MTGLAKAVDPRLFITHIAKLEIFPHRSVTAISLTFIALECSLGYGLILRLFPNWLFPTMLVFLVALSSFTYWSTATGRVEDCGCYSGLLEIKPKQSLLLNALYLMLMSLAVFHPVPSFLQPQQQLWVLLLAIMSSVACATLGIRGYRKNKNALLDLSSAQVNRRWQSHWVPEMDDNLMQGKKLVAFISAKCNFCPRWVKALKVLHHYSIFPDIVALMAEPPEVIQTYVEEKQIPFPVHFIDPTTKRRLVLGSPTVLVLEDGVIKERWMINMPMEIVEKLSACITQPTNTMVTEQ